VNERLITTTSGTPYISIIDSSDTFSIQLHKYQNVMVVLDKRVLPELIEYLTELKNESL
jgi:hypothetical protein